MNKPTPGPWLIDERTGIIVIYSGPENTEPCIDGIPDSQRIAVFNGHYIKDEHRWGMTPEQIWTARLIVVAVNACFAINPDNPLAVAEALPELVEAARTIYFKVAMIPVDWKNSEAKELSAQAIKAIDAIRNALAKLEAK